MKKFLNSRGVKASMRRPIVVESSFDGAHGGAFRTPQLVAVATAFIGFRSTLVDQHKVLQVEVEPVLEPDFAPPRYIGQIRLGGVRRLFA